MEDFNAMNSVKILRTTLAPGEPQDRLIWHFDLKGRYTVKSAYNFAMRLIDDVQFYTETPWRKIWRYKVLPKIRVFYRLLSKG